MKYCPTQLVKCNHQFRNMGTGQNRYQYGRQQKVNQSNINPISGLSENQPTTSQQRGVNNYGAEYSLR